MVSDSLKCFGDGLWRENKLRTLEGEDGRRRKESSFELGMRCHFPSGGGDFIRIRVDRPTREYVSFYWT